METKCPKCGEVYTGRCKPCRAKYMKEYSRQWYLNNKDAARSSNTAWKKRNPDKVAALDKARRDGPKRAEILAKKKAAHERNRLREQEQTRIYRVTHEAQMREWKRLWVEKNPDKVKASNTAYERRGHGKAAARAFRYREAHREECRQNNKRWYVENRHIAIAHARKRQFDIVKATPAWADMSKIAEIYREARALTLATGVVHHVDHVIPLRGKIVSGLHVETNMQILTARDNQAKHNRFIP